jgi:hypothetical protein
MKVNLILRNLFRFFLLIFLSNAIFSCKEAKNETAIDLSGEWAFQIDSLDKGMEEKWFSKNLNDKIQLPGSMTENMKGFDVDSNTRWTGQIMDSSWHKSEKYKKYRQPGNVKIAFWLQPVKYYKGAAWYQKVVDVPSNWDGRPLELFLERCHISTRLWVNDKEVGMRNSLSAPHIYELSEGIKPGKNTITICVDNRMTTVNVGSNSHSVTDHTQTNWNGIVGKMELRALAPVNIGNVKMVSDIVSKNVSLTIQIRNKSKGGAKGKLKIKALSEAGQDPSFKSIEQDINFEGSEKIIEINYPMGEGAQLWDEFNPQVYRMKIDFEASKGNTDTKELTFGLRKFETKGTHFTINNNLTFLRGTVDCAIFPLTGYVPTDTASWSRIYGVAKAHGLNHFRFHSYCPPEAAFEAADRAGFYLQVEASSWANFDVTLGDGTPLDTFIYDESNRIVDAYANHPSFCMMMYGNEPSGKNFEKWCLDYVSYWQKKDTRFLTSTGAGWPTLKESDFISGMRPRIHAWEGDKLNDSTLTTLFDWKSKISEYKIPVISHEIGQWCVYPDLKEISQYKGVLKAKNFEIFAETLKENNLGHLADSFLFASGKLQALCYKMEIEAALRTSGMGGIQLLGLQDFPGQGTALVGVVNPFWKEKGYISPGEFKSFCTSTVPLVRFSKMIYNSDEAMKASVEVAHFGKEKLVDVIPTWEITNQSGTSIAKGKLPKTTIELGNGIQLGNIDYSFSGIKVPQMLSVSVKVSEFKNSWDIWVYPTRNDPPTQSILVTEKIDQKALDVLNKGGNVLLSIKKGTLNPDMGGKIGVTFTPIFWNTAWFLGSPTNTLGILCNPKHPALAHFPTQVHSNYQWQDAVVNASAVMLSEIAPNAKPIVRMIDDWFTNRSLGLIFEAKVGKGKIMISGVDLLTNIDKRPGTRQLKHSLTSYMNSPSFNPTTEVDTKALSKLVVKK